MTPTLANSLYFDSTEIARLTHERMGLELEVTNFTMRTVVDRNNAVNYACALFGPYRDTFEFSGDRRWWVQYREVDGHRSLQLMGQDADDDAWLVEAWATEFLHEHGVRVDEKYPTMVSWTVA